MIFCVNIVAGSLQALPSTRACSRSTNAYVLHRGSKHASLPSHAIYTCTASKWAMPWTMFLFFQSPTTWIMSTTTSICLGNVDMETSNSHCSLANNLHIDVTQIRMMFIVNSFDLNVDVFNKSTSYHLLSDHGGYLKRLDSEVRDPYFTASRWYDLSLALTWKTIFFVKVVCSALDVQFNNNDLIFVLKFWTWLICHQDKNAYKIGIFINILLDHYGVDLSHRSFKLPLLIDQAACEHEFLAFKFHCIT